MKKNILIACIAVLSFGLAAFEWVDMETKCALPLDKLPFHYSAVGSFLNNDSTQKTYSDFYYDLGTRFRPVLKTAIDGATSIQDFLPLEETQDVVSYRSVEVIIIENDVQTSVRAMGLSDVLTTEQTQILKTSGYSTNFLVKADFVEMNGATAKLENNYITPHLTIVPEQQAVYRPGNEALLDFIRSKNKENTANLDESKLQPAKLYFTVTKLGTISNVRLDRTTGFERIDVTVLDLMRRLPGTWQPAENHKGEKVDQELVLSLGMVGC